MHCLRAVGLVAVIGIAVAVGGCAPEQYRVVVTPSLQPVDTARARVVFSQARGEACGRDAVAGALRDLDRFEDADGFVEVIVEGTGEKEKRCVRVVARPFRYGTSTESLTLRAGDPPTGPVLVPGRDAAPAEPEFCPTQCRRVVELVGGGSVASEMTYQRCLTRCNQPDDAFRACLQSTVTPQQAQSCLDGEADVPESGGPESGGPESGGPEDLE